MESDRERRLGLELPAWLTPILLVVIGSGAGFWLNKMDTNVEQIKDSQARIETRETVAEKQHDADLARTSVIEGRVTSLEARVSVVEDRVSRWAAADTRQ